MKKSNFKRNKIKKKSFISKNASSVDDISSGEFEEECNEILFMLFEYK